MNSQGAKLRISMHIGATSSSVATSFCSGVDAHPVFTNVSCWPGQEDAVHLERVPSALMYTRSGELIACGAEAYTREMTEGIHEHGHRLVEQFGLHLHPGPIIPRKGNHRLKLATLPGGITLSQVYTDFLAYLIAQTRRHLKDTTGVDFWPSVRHDLEIILIHPSQWGTREQQFLKQTVVAAGILSRNEALNHLKFADESEAFTTSCLPMNPDISNNMKPGMRFIICNSDGSTDILSYEVKGTTDGTTFLKKLATPVYLEAGSLSVDKNLIEHLEKRLRSSGEVNEEDIPSLIKDGLLDFQNSAKRKFSSSGDRCTVKIGGRRQSYTDPLVQKGVYTLSSDDSERLFSPSVKLMVQALKPHFDGSKHPTFLILTGGFGESPYVQNELTRTFGVTQVILPNPKFGGNTVAMGGLRLLMDCGKLFKIDRKEGSWPAWIAYLLSRLRGL